MSTATIVVDRTDRIVYFVGDTTPFVSHPSGEPTRDVFDVMKPSLRTAARTALRRAASTGEPVTIFAEVSADEPPHAVHLTAAPLPTNKPAEYFRITFERASMSSLAAIGHPTSETTDSARALATILREPAESGLEDELRTMRQELQSTVEAFEASNEELKASHEEVVSINEELQSANEELETGKEELQSLNEELITVNAQLQAKISELEATTNDLSNLLSSTNIAVVFLDTQFRVRRFTPAVYDLLELIPGDIGRPIDNLAQKFVGGGLIEDARAVLARLIPLETEVLSNSGSWYLRRTLPYRTADNHIDGVVITFVDITARRRAEQALESSQARLQSIIEQLPIAMLMVDATDGALLHANRPAAQMLNLPYPVPTIGSDWKLAAASFQGTHSDGRPYKPQDWPLTQSLTRGTTGAPQEIEFRNVDGAHGCLSMSATPILDADGKMVVAVATMFDITEQRRGAERLRESEQRLQLLIDSALDYAIFMMDLDNRIISWNRGAERLLGWSEEEAIGRSAEIIFTPEDRDASVPDREVETARRDGRAVDERVHQRKNGERFWASGMLMSVYDDKGTLCRFAKIIRDETERKRAEEDLQRALDEAERVRASAEGANRAKDEFISTISHELRTPLNTIRLWARMLGSERLRGAGSHRRRAHDRSLGRGPATSHRRPAGRVAHVSGQLRLNLRLTRLADVARSAVESVRPSADARKVQIVMDLSEDVGVVRADPERMQQVLLNLISNAVKFTPGGGRIDVADVPQRRRRDHRGEGYGYRHPPRISAARVRALPTSRNRDHPTAQRPGPGTGDRKQLVELHGGSIVAASEGAGKGATFTATLPLPRSHTEQRDSPTNARSLVAGMNGMRVLLVEDDAGSRLATCRALELSGATMDAVPNASLAMTAYTQTRPDAMILDIGLPVEDGYSLIARIRELETAQRIVASACDRAHRVRALG